MTRRELASMIGTRASKAIDAIAPAV